MSTFYNDNNGYCVQWLRNLIRDGQLPQGNVNDASITDLGGLEMANATHAHFFAGLGGWPLAVKLAGWPHDKKLWTGSCPCQPFSSAAAGKAKGQNDPRHLWPAWFKLIQIWCPPVIVGEQVETAINWGWLDNVADDLEGIDYAIGAAILPAYSVGAKQQRNRVYFVAIANSYRQFAVPLDAKASSPQKFAVADVDGNGLEKSPSQQGSWSQAGQYIDQRDWWSVEPRVGRVVHGVPSRVAKISALGNAIVPQVGAEFLRAVMEMLGYA